MTPAIHKYLRDKKAGKTSTIIGKMQRNASTTPKQDAKLVHAWLNQNQDRVAAAKESESNHLQALVDLLSSEPDFSGWDQDRIEDALLTFNHSKEQTPIFLNKEGKRMKSQLEKLISEAVKKGFNSSSSMPKITRNQLAEGVRKALRMVIEESGMPGGAMPALGNGAGSGMAITSEEAPSGGSVPSPDELSQALQTSGGWKMKIQGRDFLAYMYATQVAGLEHPDMDSGEGMHAVLSALMAAPPV